MEQSKDERKKYFQYYGFDCDCIACEKNFPTYNNFPIEGTMLKYANENYLQILVLTLKNKMTPTFAMEFLREHLMILNAKSKTDSYAKDYDKLIRCVMNCLCFLASYGPKIP